jgi:nicotinate-nucleotide adenylyltransferase
VAESGAQNPKRVLVFGGTFDPPHLAHARLPRIIADRLQCDQILYIPAAVNPLKTQGPAVGSDHRVAMLVLALADSPIARISTIELDRPGPSFTVDSLRQLREQRHEPATSPTSNEPQLLLLMGSDQALDFHRWKDWREILGLATPVVMLRPPWDERSFRAELAKRFPPDEAERWRSWTIFPTDGLPLLDISATEIRRRLTAGEPLDGLVDPNVDAYITANRLYQSESHP